MKVIVKKAFRYDGHVFEKGSVIDIPVSVFHSLSLLGIVKPYLSDVSEEELQLLKAVFEEAFKEHFERLSSIPVSISEIKTQNPDLYKKLKEAELKMDGTYLTFDYQAFTEALKEIEDLFRQYQKEKETQTEELPVKKQLNRHCVNCGSDLWLIMKPDSKTSAIMCLKCSHRSYTKKQKLMQGFNIVLEAFTIKNLWLSLFKSEKSLWGAIDESNNYS